jgi:hypothetical protein
MPFGIPVVWLERKDHFSDYHFCLTNITGHSGRTKQTIKYPDASPALKPVPHGVGLPVPQPHLETTESDPSQESKPKDAQPSEKYLPQCQDKSPHLINQKELNDLVHYLKLKNNKQNVWALGYTSKTFSLRGQKFPVSEQETLVCLYILK